MVWDEQRTSRIMVGQQTLQLSCSDGVHSELRLFPVDGGTELLLILPALGVSARKYDQLAAALNQHQISVAVMELRGIGSSSIRASRNTDFGYAELVEIDCPAAINAAQTQFPSKNLTVFGHSLGGQLGALSLAQTAERGGPNVKIPNLILSASCSIDYRGWAFPGNLSILFFTQFGMLIAKLLGYFPGRQLKFGGREARTVIADWARTARSGKYRLTGSDFDFETALSQLELKLLAINYADDAFAPQKATDNLLDKMPKTSVQRTTVTAAQLGAKRADHFNWMRHPAPVAQIISEWLLG